MGMVIQKMACFFGSLTNLLQKAESEGGRMASAVYGYLYISMTIERNKVLEQQLRDVASTH
jgi:hypothetical protein